jgi:hypothetical protein
LGAEFRSLYSLKFAGLAHPDGGGSVVAEILVVGLDLVDLLVEQDLVGSLSPTICRRISGMQLGQSESVMRGQARS